MEVFSFKSTNIEITANTAADMANCWRRFRARVGDKAETYCDYRKDTSGSLELALPNHGYSLMQTGEVACHEWKNLPPVFYETALYNISIYLTDVETAPCVLHKLKEVTELFRLLKLETTSGRCHSGFPLSTSQAYLN